MSFANGNSRNWSSWDCLSNCGRDVGGAGKIPAALPALRSSMTTTNLEVGRLCAGLGIPSLRVAGLNRAVADFGDVPAEHVVGQGIDADLCLLTEGDAWKVRFGRPRHSA
jgi:hypothetical protein